MQALIRQLIRNSARAARPAALAGAFAVLAVPPVLQAQEEELQLEEVVVTSQRRSENVQDVPIAVSAFTTETLQSKGIGDVGALGNFTPNVNLDSGAPFSGDTSVLSASIRGVGQDDFAFNIDPGVGVYLDGVYLARTIGANQNLLDVDRIEILKGPQGTLFGRNTIGGAISIVTHQPGEEYRIIATATTGSFSRRDLAFTADLPFSDKLLTSISVSSQVRDGYQEVIPYPVTTEMGRIPFAVDPQTAFPRAGYDTSEANGGQNLQVIRGKALWRISDDVSLTFAGDWSHQDQSAYPTTVLEVVADTDPARPGYGGLGGIYNLCISTPAAVLNSTPALANFNTVNGVCGPRADRPVTFKGVLAKQAMGAAPLGGAGYVGGPVPYGSAGNPSGPNPRIYWNFANTQTGDIDKTYASGPSFAKHDGRGLSATLDWNVNDAVAFKSITGWRQIDWRIGVDLDGTPEALQEVTDHQFQRQFSQEFQLSGTAMDDRLKWLGGLYYFEESGFVYDYVPFGGSLYIFDVANDVDTKSYAAFTHLEFRATEQLGLTLGMRYSKDDKEFEGGQSDLDGFAYKVSGCNNPAALATSYGLPGAPGQTCQQFLGFPSAAEPYRYFPPGIQTQKYSIFTPTLGAQWHFNDEVMGYVSYSKGFKAGGWTTRLSNPIPDISDAAFGPEYNKTYELGIKSQWFDRRLQANAAVFKSDYSSIQLNIQEGPSPVLQNAGDADIQGAELELQALVSSGLSLNLVAAYIDAEYSRVSPSAASQGITTANALPKTPEYKVTFGPQYDFVLPNSAGLRLNADFTKTGGMYNDVPNTPLLYRPASTNLNASLRYMSPDDRWELALGGTNLTNDRYLTVGSVNGGQGETVGTYNRPREWWLQLKANLSP